MKTVTQLKIIPGWARKIAVDDYQTVEEFAYKYRKPDRFTGRGEDYVKCVIKSHHEDIELLGYTSISRHDNITSQHITFIPKNPCPVTRQG